jgi:hypothetical protein
MTVSTGVLHGRAGPLAGRWVDVAPPVGTPTRARPSGAGFRASDWRSRAVALEDNIKASVFFDLARPAAA